MRYVVKPGDTSVDPGASVSVTVEPSKKGILEELGIKYKEAGENGWEDAVTMPESEDGLFRHVFTDIRRELEYVLDVSEASEGIGPYVIRLKPLLFTVKPGNTSVRPGESVFLTAEPAKRGIVEQVEIHSRQRGDTIWRNRVTVGSEEGVFRHTFANVTEDIEYMIFPRVPSEQTGPYTITVIPYPKAYKRGHALAESYGAGQIKDYMFVIELYALSETDKENFLQGFEAVYAQAGEAEKGQDYAQVLRQSISGDSFQQGFEQGRKHVNNEVTDAQIQTLIGRSIGVSRPITLGWKAGYIKGYTKMELLGKPPTENLQVAYREGQAMYDALRAVIGL